MKKFSVKMVLKVYIALLFLLALPVSAHAGLDSTSFTPPEAIEPSGGGVPVGTIVAWPVASNPKDAAKWLECNGQAVSQAVYPKLYAIVGPTVPDYRGLFLRGYGSNAAVNPQTGAQYTSGNLRQVVHANTGTYTGAMNFTVQGCYYGEHDGWLYGFPWTGHGATRDFNMSSNITIGQGETVPGNTAVRYLIRAKD